MPGTAHIYEACYDRMQSLASRSATVLYENAKLASDFSAALSYISSQITIDGEGCYTLKPGFKMDYFLSLIQGDKP